MQIVNVIKNPLTNHTLNIKVLGITLYKRGSSRQHKAENRKSTIKYMIDALKDHKKKSDESTYKQYQLKCPSCGHRGVINGNNDVIATCPRCQEAFKLCDIKKDEIIKVEESLEENFNRMANSVPIIWERTETPLEIDCDYENAKMEFQHRLYNREPLGINFKEAVKAYREQMDDELYF